VVSDRGKAFVDRSQMRRKFAESFAAEAPALAVFEFSTSAL
jgi:hypothetical protein